MLLIGVLENMKSGFLTWIVWYGCFLMMSPSEPTCYFRTAVQNFVTYKPGYLELQLEYISLAMAWKDTIIASFQIERGWVRVSLLWDKQHKTHYYRQKEHIEISNILKFGVYRAYIERETIQKLETRKIYSIEVYRCPEDVSGNPYISYKFSSSRILFNIGPINTKLQIFHILNVLFLTM